MAPSNFNFNGSPTWTVEAAYSKNRERAVRPLHPKLIEELRPWFEGKDPAAPLWPGRWAENKQAGVMMKRDLEAAGIIYREAGGLVADFHSLRHAFIANLYRAGVSPKVIQLLARHSTITLTMDRYTHVEMDDQAAALAGLPFLLGSSPGGVGPDDPAGEISDTCLSISCAVSCTELAQTAGVTCQGESLNGNTLGF